MPVKLKPSPAASPQPAFTWDDVSPSPPPPSLSEVTPPTQWLSALDMKMFGSTPLQQDFGVVKCQECAKPVLRSAMAEHAGASFAFCSWVYATDLLSTQRTVLRSAPVERRVLRGKLLLLLLLLLSQVRGHSIAASVLGAQGSTLDTTASKKRKAEDEDPTPEDSSAPKKKKPATKVTKGRTKGPVDLDKQCGVINDKGLPCSRSLTCKSHSMGAKRAVQGRSRPYDELLLDWQRLNNPNFVEPVKRESKQEKKERKEKEKAEKKKQQMEAAAAAGQDSTKKQTAATGAAGPKKSKKAATTTNTTTTAAVPGAGPVAPKQDDDENLDDVDSEAEVDSLVSAVRIAQDRGLIGVPLAVPCDAGSWFVQRRERVRTCRELLSTALMSKQNAPPAVPPPRLA